MSSAKCYIQKARVLHQQYNLKEERSFFVFSSGAKWLLAYLNIIDSRNKELAKHSFEKMGWIKYGISFFVFAFYFFIFYLADVILCPLAILGFYWAEVHFLFLFPFAIDNKKKPFHAALKATYQYGIFKSLRFTMEVALYMISGLLYLKKPFHQWRIGCLAVLLLYVQEIRNRA